MWGGFGYDIGVGETLCHCYEHPWDDYQVERWSDVLNALRSWAKFQPVASVSRLLGEFFSRLMREFDGILPQCSGRDGRDGRGSFIYRAGMEKRGGGCHCGACLHSPYCRCILALMRTGRVSKLQPMPLRMRIRKELDRAMNFLPISRIFLVSTFIISPLI